MLKNLFNKCLAGDRKACEKIYYWYWEYPRLEKILQKLTGGVTIGPLLPPRPEPGPDPAPIFDPEFLRERELVHAVLGDPNPQPSIFSLETRLGASIALRDALAKMGESLAADIQKLQIEKQKK